MKIVIFGSTAKSSLLVRPLPGKAGSLMKINDFVKKNCFFGVKKQNVDAILTFLTIFFQKSGSENPCPKSEIGL